MMLEIQQKDVHFSDSLNYTFKYLTQPTSLIPN